jgi:arylsulfatase A-like enzyme
MIPAGRMSDQPVITMDWTATILGVTGTAPDGAYPLDGEDIMPVCTGRRPPYSRTLFWRTQDRAAARVGDWKYLDESGNEQLFDLAIDPGEKNDLRGSHAEVFQRIRAQYAEWNGRMLPRLRAS